MGMAIIKINKIDDSSIFRFKRTWIEFYPALYGKIKKIYISEVIANFFLDDNRENLYEMFKNNKKNV